MARDASERQAATPARTVAGPPLDVEPARLGADRSVDFVVGHGDARADLLRFVDHRRTHMGA